MTGTPGPGQRGFALVTVLMLLALLMTLLLGYFTLTRIELSTTGASMASLRGFYAAEAGLNVRASLVGPALADGAALGGASPASGGGAIPCTPGNLGSGELGCTSFSIDGRDVVTWMAAAADHPRPVVIPRGERLGDLHARQERHVLFSEARGPDGRTEAVVEMLFDHRFVPLFQFAAFYGKDLELAPGTALALSGPVHAEGDLYLGGGAALDLHGVVTTAGALYRGRKDADACPAGAVRVDDPDGPAALPACGSARQEIPESSLGSWAGRVRTGVAAVDLPAPEALDPVPGAPYWDGADVRIVLDLGAGGPAVAVHTPAGTADPLATAALAACAGAVGTTQSLYNTREAAWIRTLDVDDVLAKVKKALGG